MSEGVDPHFDALREQVAGELATSVRPSVEWLAAEIAALHGPTVSGVPPKPQNPYFLDCILAKTNKRIISTRSVCYFLVCPSDVLIGVR